MPTQEPSRAITHQVVSRGVASRAVAEALAAVDRSAFLPAELAEQAWEDVAHLLPGEAVMPRLFVLAA